MTQVLNKQTKLIYHNQFSCLDNVTYEIKRIGNKYITLEAVYGQSQLIGLPTFRQPFNIAVNDLMAGIEAKIYTLIS